MIKKKTNLVEEYQSLTKKVENLIETADVEKLSNEDKKDIAKEIEKAMNLVKSTLVVPEK